MVRRVDMINENYEILKNFVNSRERLNRNLLIVNDEFASIVAFVVLGKHLEPEPMSINKCQHIHDWKSRKEAIEAKLDSLSKCNVIEPLVLTPHNVKS